MSQGQGVGITTGVDALASTLKHLARICADGEKAFHAAAGTLQDSNLAHLFESYSKQRAEFADQLLQELRKLGLPSAQSDSDGAAVNRGPLEVVAAAKEADEGTVIIECERAEEVSSEAYGTALETDLPAELQALLERQWMAVRQVKEQLRSLARTYQRHT